MIKQVTLLLFLSLTTIGFAQSVEKKAKKLTAEITEALSLTEEQSKAVYEIQLQRFQNAKATRKKLEDQPEKMKAELKQNGNSTFNKMKNLLGKEKMKEWKQYRKNKKLKK